MICLRSVDEGRVGGGVHKYLHSERRLPPVRDRTL